MKQSFSRKNFLVKSIGRAVNRIKSYFTKNNSIAYQPAQAPQPMKPDYGYYPISHVLARARENFDILTNPFTFDRAYNARRKAPYGYVEMMLAKAQTKRDARKAKQLENESMNRKNYYFYSQLFWF